MILVLTYNDLNTLISNANTLITTVTHTSKAFRHINNKVYVMHQKSKYHYSYAIKLYSNYAVGRY